MQPFEQTPEAQEYLAKLQSGRIELPADASPLEREILKNLRDKNATIRNLTTRQGDIEKDIGTLQAQLAGIKREIDATGGEMAGYARLLVSAEGARRPEAEQPSSPNEPKAPEPETEPPTPTDKEVVESGPSPVPPGTLAPKEQADHDAKRAEVEAAKDRMKANKTDGAKTPAA